MPLQDAILQEVLAGRLQRHWTTSDLVANKNLSSSHPLTTLRSYPPNVSASLPGLNLGDGHNVTDPPVFYRIGRRGRALFFALPDHRAVEQPAGGNVAATSATPNPKPRKGGEVQPSKKDDGSGSWSVQNPTVKSFIDWVFNKEDQNLFDFSYDINGNTLKANSIYDAAQQYNWPTRQIPPELVAHIINFPESACDFAETVKLLGLLKDELLDSLLKNDSLRHLKACWATLYWGGVATKGGNSLFYGLRYISACNNSKHGLIAYHNAAHQPGGWFDPAGTNKARLLANVEGMSAGITKIHSLLADELVIYDSRVACAVAWLVERYCDQAGLGAVPNELLFYLPKYDAGSQIQRNPAAVRPPPPNCRLNTTNTTYPNPGNSVLRKELWTWDMLRVSLILSELLSCLGKRNPQNFLEYQLGLFMIGYHLGNHNV